jgi:hypothetical protein
MSTSENERTRAEARRNVSGTTMPGRYEGAVARVLAGLAVTAKVREKWHEKAAEGDQSKPDGR